MSTEKAPRQKVPLGGRYWRLWTASVISNLVAQRLPWLIFTLPAGVITDRLDRRRIMVWADVARAALVSVIATAVLIGRRGLPSPEEVAGGGDIPTNGAVYGVLLGAVLLLGFAEVLRDNAGQTFLPALVKPEALEKANGSLWGAEMLANSFIGPPLGSLLLGVGFALPFFVNAGGYAVAAGLIFLIAGQFRAKGAASPGTRVQWRVEMKEGFFWLWHHELLRPMAIILGLLNGLGMMMWATFVLFAQEELDLETGLFTGVFQPVAHLFGFQSVGTFIFTLLIMGGAVGGIIGSLLAARVSKALGSGPSLYLTILGGAVTAAVTGIATRWWLAFLMTVIATFTSILWNVITVSLRQTIIPDHLLGRVNSVYRFFGWGMMPIGSLIGGAVVALGTSWVSRSQGLRWPFFVVAGGHMALLIYALPRLTTAKIEGARVEALARHEAEQGPGSASPVGTGEARAAEPPAVPGLASPVGTGEARAAEP
ncbi:MAG: MFS transporter, partial [Acidimicrobiia bacterium]|nr:MFS transporter [Acidimicrobiia bacterium]